MSTLHGQCSEETVSLSAPQIEMILQADRAFQNGEESFTTDEVMDRARKIVMRVDELQKFD